MSVHLMKLVSLDMEIDKLLFEKECIDNRLDKLYVEREDVYVEYMNLNKPEW